MTDNVPVKVITAAELKKLRNVSEVVFTARINQSTPLTNVTEITYDGGTGTYTDIKTGYLVWIGSATGLHDKGVTHIRTTTSSTKIFTDQIDFTFADDDYITVTSLGRQFCKLGLHIQRPATVYTMRINQTFTSLDGVTELTYDGGSGTLADIIPGMTVLIGSAAGLFDKGTCRVRKTPTATVLYINQVSNIPININAFLPVSKISLYVWFVPSR